MKKYILPIIAAAAVLAGTAGVASANGMFGGAGNPTQLKTRLDASVTAGKITVAQEQLIIAKMTEVHAKVEAIQNDLKAWATANNIPDGFLGGPMQGFGKNKDSMGMGMKAARQ